MSEPFWFLLGGFAIGHAVGTVEDWTGWSWPFFAMTGMLYLSILADGDGMSHRTFDDPKSIDARQHLLDNRSEHAPKRHRTAKRKSRARAARQAAGKHKAALNAAAISRRLAVAHAFWNGTRDDMR